MLALRAEQHRQEVEMAALGGRQPIRVQLMAYSGKKESATLYANELTAVSLPGFLTQFGALTSAIDAVTVGRISETEWGELTTVSNTRPTSKQAQLESSLLVLMQGATTEQPWSFRIPTVDFSAFNYAAPPAGDYVIFAGAGATTVTTDLVTAIQAIAKAPWDETEALVVVGMLAER